MIASLKLCRSNVKELVSRYILNNFFPENKSEDPLAPLLVRFTSVSKMMNLLEMLAKCESMFYGFS